MESMMCNRYSVATNQAAIAALFRVVKRTPAGYKAGLDLALGPKLGISR
jgi:hypothetical protein